MALMTDSDLVQIRQVMKRATLDDISKGAQYVKLRTGRGEELALFVGPVLQYRYKRTVYRDGVKSTEFSEWLDVAIVLEETAPGTAAPLESKGN